MTERSDVFSRGRGQIVLAVLGVLLVASCLRPAITSVGPVLHRIGDSTGLGSGALGLLGALPPLAFAAVSPFAYLVARRFGLDRAVLLGLIVLTAGITLRSLPLGDWAQVVALLAGTFVLGTGIAIGNVLVPAVVKRDFAGHITRITGAYTSTMNTFAAVASGISVPLAGLAVVGWLSDWRLAVGVWAVPAVIAVVLWVVRMRVVPAASAGGAAGGAAVGGSGGPSTSSGRGSVGSGLGSVGSGRGGVAGRRGPSVWRSALAWQVTLHMGLQSTVFYTLVNWLPSIESDQGVSASAAGGHLFGYQAVGIFAALLVGAVMGRFRDQRGVAIMITVPMLIALVGLMIAPQFVLGWAMLAGLTSGSAIAVALALIGLRSRTVYDAARLSGMAQSMGYLLAAGGPLAAGALRELTGSWLPVIVLLILITLGQAIVGALAGRARYVGQ